jgi:hypothetical protein
MLLDCTNLKCTNLSRPLDKNRDPGFNTIDRIRLHHLRSCKSGAQAVEKRVVSLKAARFF